MATPPSAIPATSASLEPQQYASDELQDSITVAPPMNPSTQTPTFASASVQSPSPDSRKRSIDSVAADSKVGGSGSTTRDAKQMVAGLPAPKKARLTTEERKAEKEAKEKEKEDKLRMKEEEKRKKEEEKRRKEEARELEKTKKEEEKRRKEEEKRRKEEAREEEKQKREEEKQKREEEKRRREEEKRRKEEEKQKKERSQLKLNNFFVRTTPQKPPSLPPGTAIATSTPPAPKKELSDYQISFQPFFVKPHMVLAPVPFQRDAECKRIVSENIDAALAEPLPSNDPDTVAPVKGTSAHEMAELLHLALHQRRRTPRTLAYTTKDIVARINAPDDPGLPPIGPAARNPAKTLLTPEYYLKLLNSLPHKSLKFFEDVRPPYSGTFTRQPTSGGLKRGAKPFDRALPGVDYDYDSEVEWVADEEGEELLSDEEDDKESISGSDDLDGFLDDEDDVAVKRGTLGALVAINSGICWEDEKGRNPRPDLDEMRAEILLEGALGPIDPFSSSYWYPTSSQKTAMAPPRQPLNAANQNIAVQSTVPATPTAVTLAAAASTGKKFVPPEEMANFKAAIDGSDMTKAGLIEVLKKTFPKITKDAIKNTLDLVAERVGDKKDDKRWVLKN